ncbi:MAG: ADP-ribose pyrophosphatase, partial [Lachnospiraceae bacterium]|nr:ADP-ribose pyrophosphatase [Lachnospiraceae bacterium]
GIAFDHARIVTGAFNRLQRMLDSDIRIAFDFMPEQFTLTDLQEAVELISGQELIKPNFRRKVNEYVRETDTQVLNGGHRPAKAYVRNLERFYR